MPEGVIRLASLYDKGRYASAGYFLINPIDSAHTKHFSLEETRAENKREQGPAAPKASDISGDCLGQRCPQGTISHAAKESKKMQICLQGWEAETNLLSFMIKGFQGKRIPSGLME